MKRLLFLVGLGVELNATLQAGAAETPVYAVHPVPKKTTFFSLSDVRLLEGPLQHQQELNREYFLRLEPDRLLSWFRREAGLDPKAPPYRGWESEGRPCAGTFSAFT